VSCRALSSAEIKLPIRKTVKEDGKDASKAKGITFIKYEKGKAVYELKSGSYEFTTSLNF
jgi:alpha-L-rhamnosidase